MDTWEIILDDWVTMDWGYNDLAVGEAFSSPIFFIYDGLVPATERQKCAERLDGPAPTYRVTGEIIGEWIGKGWALDCGVCAFAGGRLSGNLSKGDYVTCEIELGIDYLGADVISNTDWEIKAITRCTVPRILNQSRHIPDWEQHTCHQVARTDGWRDGQFRELIVWYVLHCRKIDPTHSVWDSESIARKIHQWDRRMKRHD